MNPHQEPKNVIKEKYCSVHVQDIKHLLVTRLLLPYIQGKGCVWYCGSWTQWVGHAGGVDAGVSTAVRIGGVFPFKNETMINDYFSNAAKELFGIRFDFRRSMRKQCPIL